MNYYNEIKDVLIKNEVYKKVKDYSKNRSDLNSYYEVGRLIVEAQGGEARAGYGNKLIKEYSERLTKELGKGYNVTNLKRMRQFYLFFQKGAAVRHQLWNLNWTHYRILLPLNDITKIEYYVNVTVKYNLSSRELEKRIKNKEYERIGYKEELERPKVTTLIKNPIIIKTGKNIDKVSEYVLHNLILEDMDNFLKELGVGFTYVGNEVKIKIGDRYNRIDFLLFNYNYNCFVVVELKVTELKAEYIGQISKYIGYVDKNIRKSFHEKTVGVIICKKDNKFVMEYCTNPNIFTTWTYVKFLDTFLWTNY